MTTRDPALPLPATDARASELPPLPATLDEASPALLQALEGHAPTLSFFELVQLLERLSPGGTPVGGAGPACDEPVRFRHDVRPIFHSGDIAGLRSGRSVRGHRIVEITTTFLGVVGARSPLPSGFTEDLARSDGPEEASLRAFYDVFHHRLLGLVYRGLARGSPAASVREDGRDPFTRRTLALAGRATASVDARGAFGRRAALGVARLTARRPRSRAALEAALEVAFPDLGLRVGEVALRDVPIPTAEVCRLGTERVRLGVTCRLGDLLPRQPSLLVVASGPVDGARLRDLMPGGALYPRLRGVVFSVTGGPMAAELRVDLLPGAEPGLTLGAGEGSTLGLDALLSGEWEPRGLTLSARVPLTEDPAAAVPQFTPAATAPQERRGAYPSSSSSSSSTADGTPAGAPGSR